MKSSFNRIFLFCFVRENDVSSIGIPYVLCADDKKKIQDVTLGLEELHELGDRTKRQSFAKV